MHHQIRLFFLVGCMSLLNGPTFGQNCHPDSLRLYEIRAQDTDPQIDWELNTHFSWYNPTCTSNGLLLVHMVGTFDNPKNTTFFPELAANLGYHVVSLKYLNGISAQSPCRNSEQVDCYTNFRREIVEGVDSSPDVEVDTANSIENRLLKLLQYLHAQNPAEGWDVYYSETTLNWSQMALSGHSQGGGHAAFMAKDRMVAGVFMFASPNDYSAFYSSSAPWTGESHVTPDSAYYFFGHLFDDIVDFAEQYAQVTNLGLVELGDTILINGADCPYNNSHLLYTTDPVPGFSGQHNAPVRDDDTPLDEMGQPLYQPVWAYMLGAACNISNVQTIHSTIQLRVFPNPLRSETVFQFDTESNPTGYLLIRNSEGRLLQRIELQGTPQVVWQRGGLPDGLYLYEWWSGAEQLGSGKLILH